MFKNADYNGSLETRPYKFRYYDINEFSFIVKRKILPSEDLFLVMGHEKTSVMRYRTLFEGYGIHHWKLGPQITHDMYIKV